MGGKGGERQMNIMMMPNELMTAMVTTSTTMMRRQSYKENMNMDDDEHASYDDGGQKHIYIYTYVSTQGRNGCYVNADSYRMANYCNGVQAKSKQVM